MAQLVGGQIVWKSQVRVNESIRMHQGGEEVVPMMQVAQVREGQRLGGLIWWGVRWYGCLRCVGLMMQMVEVDGE